MQQHLRINSGNIPYDDGYKEDFVTLLSTEELKAFNEINPRPENLLEGDEAVMKYLDIGPGK